MGYDEFILTVNVASIIIMLVMAFLLCSASRFRGESSYAALIIVLTTIPVYIYNVCRSLEWYDIAFFFAPFAFSVNLTLMPLLWLFVQRCFNPRYHFLFVRMAHFLPALISFIIFLVVTFSLPQSQYYDFMIHENTGYDTWLGKLNLIILLVQVIGYFLLIFIYLHKVKHFIKEHYTEAELQHKVWIPRFITLFALLFVIVVVCYMIWPRFDSWLMQLLTIIAMAYLLYSELEYALQSRLRNAPSELYVEQAKTEFIDIEVKPHPQGDVESNPEEIQKLKHYAHRVEVYLCDSEVYVNPNLSLNDVAAATNISAKKISKAINEILGKNFFDLINGFRIEKSKALLLDKKEKGLTIEAIATQCGFNSRITFNNAFKKITGLTTSQWLKLTKVG